MDGRVTAERVELGRRQIAELQEQIRRQCALVDRLLAEGRDAPVIRNEEDRLGKMLSKLFTLLTEELDVIIYNDSAFAPDIASGK